MNSYILKILSVIQYSNNLSMLNLIDNYSCDKTAIEYLIQEGILVKHDHVDKVGFNIVMLSDIGSKLLQTLNLTIELTLLGCRS